LKLLHLETIVFSDATLSDIKRCVMLRFVAVPVLKYSEKFYHFAKRRMEVMCGRSFEDGGVAALPQLLQFDIRLQLTERRIPAECRVSLRLPPTEPEVNNQSLVISLNINIIPELLKEHSRIFCSDLRRYDMNGRSQMQGGKNWILLKEINATGSSETLIDRKSGKTTYVLLWDRMEGAWLWTLVRMSSSHFSDKRHLFVAQK
jgi:hypothetical protein